MAERKAAHPQGGPKDEAADAGKVGLQGLGIIQKPGFTLQYQG